MPSSTHRQRKLAASTAQDQAGSLGAGGGAGVLAGAGAGAGSVSEVTVKEVMEMTEYFFLARLSAGVTALHMVTTLHTTLLAELSASLAGLCRGAAPTQMIFTSRAAITVRPSPGSWG